VCGGRGNFHSPEGRTDPGYRQASSEWGALGYLQQVGQAVVQDGWRIPQELERG
jgi:hypothetical protein